MQIQVLYFAVFRERLGKAEEELALAETATVADAIAALANRHPVIAQLRGRNPSNLILLEWICQLPKINL